MLPRVILYNAVSLDGRIDGFVPDIGRYYELAGRFKEDATLAGAETILSPMEPIPPEDERAFEPPHIDPKDPRPLLAVPDSRGRVRHWHYLRIQPYWRAMVALCSKTTPNDYFDYLKRRHVEWIVAGDDHVDLRAALEELNARYDVKVVRVDSGGTLNGVLLRAGLVSEVSVLIHPTLVGSATPKTLFRDAAPAPQDGIIPLNLTHAEPLGAGLVWLRYDVAR
jgi:2,5-diamino-6-(ribosylamino)-4(3H)-pyrimidinone 5'-phosphate reductase